MAELFEHVRENYVAYAAVAVCLLPIIYVTRRYSVPTILYTIEIFAYCAIMHVVFGVIVRVARWFKENSSMRALRDGKPLDAPDWTTPWIEFWKTEEYRPETIWKVEAVLAVLIILAVFRYRPLRVQKMRDRKFDDSGKKRRPGAGGMDAKSWNARGKSARR